MKARSESATRFALESELCGVLSELISTTLSSPHDLQHVFPEFHVGTVIPDLVLVYGQGSAGGKKRRLSSFDSWIVAELLKGAPRKPITIADRLFAHPDRTREALDKMVRSGLVERSAVGTYRLASDTLSAATEIVAVEAKLTRWRDAVSQAKEYLKFANRSYVALPSDLVERIPEISSTCRTAGIGVLAVERGSVNLRAEAKRYEVRSPDWVWVVSKTMGLGSRT